MLGIDTIRQFAQKINRAVKQRRQKKLAEIAEIERKDRDNKTASLVELSLKEIMFIERDIQTWARHFRVRKIYEPS